MKFNKKTRKILSAWLSDVQSDTTENDFLMYSFLHAVYRYDCDYLMTSCIATAAHINTQSKSYNIKNNADIVIEEIKKYFDIHFGISGFIHVVEK